MGTLQNVLNNLVSENRKASTSVAAKPFLKWVGGKRSILPQLIERLPNSYACYHERFLGGGALFFETQPNNAVLADINVHLIITYIAVRDDVDKLVHLLADHARSHSKEYYLACRQLLSSTTEPTAIAALCIYLNKTCYNGLYRVNRAGKFNVPMGRYKTPTILDEDNIRVVSHLLQGKNIQQCSFTQITPQAGDFYYFDPPYHKTYDQYSQDKFADKQHANLAKICRQINAAGAYFMVSNSDTEFVKQLYKEFVMEHILATRNVSCQSNQRGKHNELIIRNYE